jgi:TPR repeat protein
MALSNRKDKPVYTSTHLVAYLRTLHDNCIFPITLYYMENDMEAVYEALNINDDNLPALLDTADMTGSDGMFELYIQYREAGDETEAQKWLRKAADQGHCGALGVLSTLVDEDERLAHELKAAALGCDQAQYNLGMWYMHYLIDDYEPEDYVPEDYAQAAFWLTKAANLGNKDAKLRLGLLYLEGQGVPQDDDIAVAWIRKSAEQEHVWAYYELGMMYLKGRGVPQNDEEAVAWFLKGAKLMELDSTYQLGVMYLKGRGVGQDDEEGCFWIRWAARWDNREAQALLGEMLELGHATPKNLDEAAEWLSKAADMGDEDAQVQLDRLLRSGVLDPRARNRTDLHCRAPGTGRILH